MERGLLWLPLLGMFIGLAWAGWNEYRKLEAYKVWAADFERAKYDIYAALGQQDDRLIWGKPTRKGPDDLQTVSLYEVTEITLHNQKTPPPTEKVPKGCETFVCLVLRSGTTRWIPFTDIDLALAWQNQLQRLQESLQSTPNPS